MSAREREHNVDREELAELRARVAELVQQTAAVRTAALREAADAVARMLADEPSDDRAFALYEALTQIRYMLPCTCARSQGLHEKECARYVPGHDLLSPVRQLARAREELTAEAGKDTPTGGEPGRADDEVRPPVCPVCQNPGCCCRCFGKTPRPDCTPVAAYPGSRDEEPLRTRTRSQAWTLGHGAAVVSVDGYTGGIALTHIDPIEGGDHHG